MRAGDFVKVNPGNYSRTTGYGHVSVPEDNAVVVTRVYNDTIWAKWSGSNTFIVPKNYLVETDPNAPKPRRLGDTPEGDYIAADDPRIAWVWEDAAKVATSAGHCREYDELADKLGVPGRERSFTVEVEVKGLTLKATVKARSRKLAEQMVNERIKED